MNETQMKVRKAERNRAIVISTFAFTAIILASYFGVFEALNPFDGK